MGAAVEMAFEAATSESRRLEEAAMILRRHILQTQSAAQQMSWPPSADYLLSMSNCKHPSLTDFLAIVISGKSWIPCQRSSQIASSIAEDLCATAGVSNLFDRRAKCKNFRLVADRINNFTTTKKQ